MTRLGELSQAELIADVDGSYELTAHGQTVAGRLRELAQGTATAPATLPVAEPPVAEPRPARPSPGPGPRPRR